VYIQPSLKMQSSVTIRRSMSFWRMLKPLSKM